MGLLSFLGCVFLSILTYLTATVLFAGLCSLMVPGNGPADDDMEVLLLLGYIAGLFAFVIVMYCWADGVPFPFN